MPTTPSFPQQRRLLPSIKALAAFESVARLNSFTRAAAELSLSQSAVSKQISALETQLGLQLFESKRTHGVRLTPEGQFYFENISRILADLSTTTASAIASADDMRTLRLGLPGTYGSRWLMPRLNRFLAQEPDMSIEFSTRVGTRLEPGFGGLDASIEFADNPDTPHAWELLMPWRMVVVAAPQFAADYDLKSVTDLSRVSVLLHRSDVALWGEWAPVAMGETPLPKTVIFEAYPMVFQAAVVGLGAAIVPRALIARELSNGELILPFPLDLQSPHQCYFVHPRDRIRSKPLQKFRDWLIKEAATG